MNKNKDILQLNANLKYIEFVLNIFDNENNSINLGEIRKSFKNKFKVLNPLLNQYFGIIKLATLLFISDYYKKKNIVNVKNLDKIKIIRNSFAHNDFIVNEEGYIFKNRNDELKISFNNFQKLIYQIENDFYK